MSLSSHVEEFKKALHGVRGDLDSWLEVNNESECKAAILGLISQEIMQERARCKKVIEEIVPKESQLSLITKGFSEALDI